MLLSSQRSWAKPQSSSQPHASGKRDPKPSWIPGPSWFSQKPSHACCCWPDSQPCLLGNGSLMSSQWILVWRDCAKTVWHRSQRLSPLPPLLERQIKLLQESEALLSTGFPHFRATSWSNFSWRFFRNSNSNMSGLIKPNSGLISKENIHLLWSAPT